ncbi:glycoside hydrolase family 78 protein [Termitidicoccus mucosus]|uniref:alpha-L-rhamnosidase n=1 Tax=Termitidicoccus mucosus TaxID=1184151 RepID=A0A178IIA9_9BACT|nr:hypothetical protein AW736_08585 [Opitutaceae bacterium TSB47]
MKSLVTLRSFLPLAALLLSGVFSSPALHAAGLAPAGLRCDWGRDPSGIDSGTLRLAWSLESTTRGARQTAWQVRVSSTRERLAAGEADAWDSGRVDGDAQLQVPYGGRALRTGERVFWQVRVWDETGAVSPWSETATWTMGVVQPGDWQAKWITDPELVRVTRRWLGFSTPPVTDENTPQWVMLDLGRDHAIEEVGLHALVHTVNERLGFPRWFKVELSRTGDFRDAAVIADHTREPVNLWFTRVMIPANGITARYVRLSAPRLRMIAEDEGAQPLGRLALSQMEVRSGGKNIAPGAKVTASASLEEGPWSAEALVDGIGLPGSNPRATTTLLLRREFPVEGELRRAVLFVCGLGYYTLSVNGAEVGAEDLLKPGWTDYTKTCIYDTRDITAQLRAGGANAIGLTLANGMYNVQYSHGRYTKFVGPPRAQKALVQLRLEYGDGRVETVVSDPQWKVAAGPTVFEHAYGGEDYDAGLEPRGWDRPGFDDSKWTAAVETAGPGGRLVGFSHASPPMRAHETLKPVAVRGLRPGVTVYDFGQNTALMPVLRVRGPKGASVKLRPSELVNPDGSINWRSTHNSKAEAGWNYRLAGHPDGEDWAPKFFYHGARYLQVEVAAPEGGSELPVVGRLDARVVHSDSPAVGHFACSNELFNRIRMLVRWAQRSNMAHVLTDCPHRERLGWLEQDHLNGPSLRSEFDLTRLFSKIFGDMEDAQLENGLVPSIAPEYIRFDGWFRDSPEWGSTLILAAWQQFVWTGDDTPLHRHYPAMQRYFDYLTRRADGHILSHGLGDWCDLGPTGSGHSSLTPVPLVATATYYEGALAMERIAQHLRRSRDARRYAELADEIAEAFNARFLDKATAVYATGSQTSQVLPLTLGIVPFGQYDAVLARLVQAVRAAGNGITTGEIGHPYLLRGLSQAGRADLVFAIHNQTDRPGYGYQLERGATTLVEAWDASPNVSQNHFMLGHITEWFYQYLAGIMPDASGPGFARVIVRPEPAGDVAWAEASIDTVRGRVAVRWDRGEGKFALRVTVPPNARAGVQLPVPVTAVITESGRATDKRDDLTPLGAVDGRPAFEIGAGEYAFEASWQK